MDNILDLTKLLRITRPLSSDNCPWFPLEEIIFSGTVVREFTKPTYGSISENGIAITFDLKDGDYPFLEVPLDAVEPFPMEEPKYLDNTCMVCGEPQLGVHYHE